MSGGKPRRRRSEQDCVVVATDALGRDLSIYMALLLLQNRNSVQLRFFDSGLQVLQARLGGVCTGRGLSCGAFWVIYS